MDLVKSSLHEVVENIKSKKISSKEVVGEYLRRIDKLNPLLNAYVHLSESALEEAEALDARIVKGEEVGRLAGVPIGIKDMICTKGLRTTAASKALHNFVPPYDATLVCRLKQSGAVILGKLNQDEFAMGSSNETSFFGATKNPWDLNRTPGGSSGGSAAAQAARLAVATIGTDTGGSIRQPASYCGVVGVKPTYGRISRYGVIAYASSLDQAGPFANSVKDASLLLEVMSGFDQRDSTCSQQEVPAWSQQLNTNIKGMKIGILKEFVSSSLHPSVQNAVEKAVDNLKNLGAEIIEVSVPLTSYSIPMYYLIASAEASSNLARYDGVKYGHRAQKENLAKISLEDFYGETRAESFGDEVKRRIMLGTYCLSSGYFDAYYNKASQVRRLLVEQFKSAFSQCDVILSPVTTGTAFKLGEKISNPIEMYLNDIFTTATNLAGLPGMSLPYALSDEGLPVGIQLQANHFCEQKMLDVAAALELTSQVKECLPDVV